MGKAIIMGGGSEVTPGEIILKNPKEMANYGGIYREVKDSREANTLTNEEYSKLSDKCKEKLNSYIDSFSPGDTVSLEGSLPYSFLNNFKIIYLEDINVFIMYRDGGDTNYSKLILLDRNKEEPFTKILDGGLRKLISFIQQYDTVKKTLTTVGLVYERRKSVTNMDSVYEQYFFSNAESEEIAANNVNTYKQIKGMVISEDKNILFAAVDNPAPLEKDIYLGTSIGTGYSEACFYSWRLLPNGSFFCGRLVDKKFSDNYYNIYESFIPIGTAINLNGTVISERNGYIDSDLGTLKQVYINPANEEFVCVYNQAINTYVGNTLVKTTKIIAKKFQSNNTNKTYEQLIDSAIEKLICYLGYDFYNNNLLALIKPNSNLYSIAKIPFNLLAYGVGWEVGTDENKYKTWKVSTNDYGTANHSIFVNEYLDTQNYFTECAYTPTTERTILISNKPLNNDIDKKSLYENSFIKITTGNSTLNYIPINVVTKQEIPYSFYLGDKKQLTPYIKLI